MLRLLKMLAVAVLCAQAPPVLTASPPDDEHLESARALSGEAVEQARHLSRDADFKGEILREADRALSAAVRAGPGTGLLQNDAFPDIDAETLAKARTDLKALLTNPGMANPERLPTDGAAPLIFVSFSMPEDSLRALLMEAALAGSPVLLRGLVDDSMQRTAARLGELLGTEDRGEAMTGKVTPSVAIDPTLFERFDVDKVPTFVLPLRTVAPCTPEGCPVPEHFRIAGDVSLDYALAVMAREASDTPLGNHAREWRRRLDVQR